MKLTHMPLLHRLKEVKVLTIAEMTMSPNIAQRLESIAILVLVIGLYINFDSSWLLFGTLILLPDISISAYLIDDKVGSIVYNLFHTYLSPIGAYLILSSFALPFSMEITLVWIAHIAIDRSLGYGLKFPTNFKHTHLSWK